MDNLKQIDSILKKAAADVPANAMADASDWNAIEQRLKYRKNRIIGMWFFLALSIFTAVSYTITRQKGFSDTVQNSNSSLKVTSIRGNDPLKEQIETSEKLIDINREKENISTGKKDDVESKIETGKKINKKPEYKPVKLNILDDQKSTFTSLQRVKMCQLYAHKKIKIKPELIFYQNNLKVSKQTHSKNHKNWEYGIAFTPAITHKYLKENKALSGLINRNFKQFIESKEDAAYTTSLGLDLVYHFNSKLFFSSGVYSTQRSEQINYNYTITEFPIVTNGKITDYAPLNPLAYENITFTGSNLYHFIEIPLNIGYRQSISTNFEIRTQFGLSLMSLTKREGKKGNFLNLKLDDLTNLTFNNQNIATSIKTGLYYNKPRLVIGLEPNYAVNLNALNDKKTNAILSRPYSYGINIITNVKLNKK